MISIYNVHNMLLKPADRLGKVVLANEVSIGGVGGGRLPRCTEISISSGDKGGQLDFFRGAWHVPLGNLVRLGFDSP